MKKFFAPNIDRKGRILRGLLGLALLVSAAFCIGQSVWLGILLAVLGLFGLLEAVRGWCFARACGLRTRF